MLLYIKQTISFEKAITIKYCAIPDFGNGTNKSQKFTRKTHHPKSRN